MRFEDNLILNNKQIEHKTRRIAFQIFESNVDEKEIILAGIANNGYTFAKRLKKILDEITDKSILVCKVEIDKKKPLSEVKTSLAPKEYRNKSVVLVDDVLNSGTTLIYGVKHFLDVPLKRFKTAVLVNRNHKKYPVKADYKGISLSTTLKEHINITFDGKKTRAVLE